MYPRRTVISHHCSPGILHNITIIKKVKEVAQCHISVKENNNISTQVYTPEPLSNHWAMLFFSRN
jgi:hypothetical protein